MHLNIQSIKNKLDELKHFLATNNIDVCSINETWLAPTDRLVIPTYQIFRKDRTGQRGGGVCILVHERLLAAPVSIQSTEEIVMVKINNCLRNGQSLAIGSYYSPPDQPIDSSLLHDLAATHPNLIIMGDLNCHHELWNDKKKNASGQLLADLLENSDLGLLDYTIPTYCLLSDPDYSALIDVVMVSDGLFTPTLLLSPPLTPASTSTLPSPT